MNIAFVGLSNKEGKKPLDSSTKSGILIDEVINKLEHNILKTNLCNFTPLDENCKLRYPTQKEMDNSVKDLLLSLSENNCNIVFLLGDKVTHTLEKFYKTKIRNIYEHEGVFFISVKHPSYIMTYKRKEKDIYIENIINIINKIGDEINC